MDKLIENKDIHGYYKFKDQGEYIKDLFIKTTFGIEIYHPIITKHRDHTFRLEFCNKGLSIRDITNEIISTRILYNKILLEICHLLG